MANAAQATTRRRSGQEIVGLGLATGVILAGSAYLIAIPFGWVGNNRLGLPEAVIFCAMLLFAVIMGAGMESISLSSKGLELVRSVEQKQLKQAREIETLQFLVNYFVTDSELSHLRRLAGQDKAPYGPLDAWHLALLQGELRRLRSLNLIQSRPNLQIGEMTREGDLAERFEITERGRQYLALRDHRETSGV